VSDSIFLGGNPPFQPSASVSHGSVDNPGKGANNNSFPLPVTTQDPVFFNPEAWTWNAALQREVGFQTTVEVAYVGRRGLHLQQEDQPTRARHYLRQPEYRSGRAETLCRLWRHPQHEQ